MNDTQFNTFSQSARWKCVDNEGIRHNKIRCKQIIVFQITVFKEKYPQNHNELDLQCLGAQVHICIHSLYDPKPKFIDHFNGEKRKRVHKSYTFLFGRRKIKFSLNFKVFPFQFMNNLIYFRKLAFANINEHIANRLYRFVFVFCKIRL